MPTQSRNPSSNTRPSENRNTSHRRTSQSPQNHLTSNTAPKPPNTTRQRTPMQSTLRTATLPVVDPAFAKQRELEDQLASTTKENLRLVKENLQLQGRALKFEGQLLLPQGEIADLQEQLLNLREKSKHIERNACDAAEGHKLELSRFRATVSNGLKETSIRRRQVHDNFASDLTAALKLRMERLQDCDHLVLAALGEVQESKAGSNDRVQTPAEQPQEVPQPRTSIFGGDLSSRGNHGDRSTDGSTGVPSAQKMVEDGQAAGTAASPRAPDTASRKRSMAAESSGEAISKERDKVKNAKTTDQQSPHREEEGFSRTYPAINTLLGKDDATYHKALEQIGPKTSASLDESSRERLTVMVGAKGMGRKGIMGKTNATS